jgi:hypothetical protein
MNPPGFGPIGSSRIGALPDLDSYIEQGRRVTEKYIGLPSGILSRIWGTDDWTFVLQLHGLLEAAVDQLVVVGISESTKSWVLDLDLQSGKGSKVSFGLHHGSLSRREANLIRHLSTLRARYAHDIRMTTVALTDYLSRPESKNLFDGLMTSVFVEGKSPAEDSERRKWLLERPRDTLHLAVSEVLGKALDVKVIEKHALTTEDEIALATEDGTILVDESAPKRPQR